MISFDHPIPWEFRPVYDLQVPKMTKRNIDSNPGLFVLQARAIAEFIKAHPESWRGIVLTSSNFKVKTLRGILSSMLNGRVFEPPRGASLAERVETFCEDPRDSIIAVDTIQGWGSGLDLQGDLARIAVVAGVPFQNPTDPFVKARQQAGGDAYLRWQSYMSVTQATGRVARGEKDEHGDWLLNVAAVADGSAMTSRARQVYPDWFEVRKWRNGQS
jgi:Rad3-related DNA helicase